MAFQFKVQLKGITTPAIWRTLLLPEQFTFLQFHEVIQAAFGWQNRHLFHFSPSGGYRSHPVIAVPNPEWDSDPVSDCKKVRLSDIFTTPKQKFGYLYDFGDGWLHSILLEEITDARLLYADCIAGKGACPPEDCGGVGGYHQLKLIMKFNGRPEHAEMKEWLVSSGAAPWGPDKFDLEAAKKAVRLKAK